MTYKKKYYFLWGEAFTYWNSSPFLHAGIIAFCSSYEWYGEWLLPVLQGRLDGLLLTSIKLYHLLLHGCWGCWIFEQIKLSKTLEPDHFKFHDCRWVLGATGSMKLFYWVAACLRQLLSRHLKLSYKYNHSLVGVPSSHFFILRLSISIRMKPVN